MRTLSSTLRSGVLASTAGVFGSAFLWLLSFKAVAYWMGPEGVGLFSQLRQIAQAATVGATFGGTNSVVQGLAERAEEISRREFRATAIRLVGMAGVLVVMGMVLAAPQLTGFFLSSNAQDLITTMRWIGLAVLLNVGGTYALAVLNGYRSFFYLALAQIVGPLALLMLLVNAWWWQWPPAPILLASAFVACFGMTCLVGAFGVSRLPSSATLLAATGLSKDESRAFIKFAFSNLFAALSTTVALLLIRAWVIEAEGLAFSGLFDAGWTLTFNYTTLFLTACSAIYLPLLTAATGPDAQKACMLKTAYLVLGVSVVICYAMVLFQGALIELLYSAQFQATGQVLNVLVIAVVFRGVSWVYGSMILATRNARVLLVSDIALNLGLLASVKFCLVYFSTLSSLAWAFVLPNFLYLVFVVEYASYKNNRMRRREIWPMVVTGVAPLVFLAFAANGDTGKWTLGQWACMVIGIIVGGGSLHASRKIVL
jgi:O-antigen/teichoic acid export membrane protein